VQGDKMQAISGFDRHKWASSIGWIIYSLNEVDYLLMYAYKVIAQQSMSIELYDKWKKCTTSDRLKMVELAMKDGLESPATLRIKRIIVRTKCLLNKRNHVAHGMLVLTGTSQFEMLRYNKASNETISMNHFELLDIEAAARKLSDDFSLLISMCSLHKEFVKPYEPGAPQGFEELRPYDPAPAI
jgi:hypothetical protein